MGLPGQGSPQVTDAAGVLGGQPRRGLRALGFIRKACSRAWPLRAGTACGREPEARPVSRSQRCRAHGPAAEGLSLDLVGGLEIVPFARRLADRVPDLRIMIDHLAGVHIDGAAPAADWLEQMKALATARHVSLKVSGLVEGSGRRRGQAPGDVEFYRPVLDAIWTRFGPDRLVYGSNWPVCELFAPLATVQKIAHDYFASQGRKTLEKVFARNARAFYRWQDR